jgi:hypothetical protein
MCFALFIIAFSSQVAFAQTTLRDQLTAPQCPAACFLGIIPGITSRSELEAILKATDIVYRATPLGLSDTGLISYVFDVDLPYLSTDSESISVIVAGDIVGEVLIDLSDVTVHNILEWYGAPDSIGWFGSHVMVYINEGLVFIIPFDDHSIVDFLMLRSPGLSGGFALWTDTASCMTEVSPICLIATATPTFHQATIVDNNVEQYAVTAVQAIVVVLIDLHCQTWNVC